MNRLFVVFLAIVLLICPEAQAQLQKAPDIIGADTAGSFVSLYSMKQKTILIMFWSADCETCKEHISDLINLCGIYKKKQFGMFTFCISPDESAWKELISVFHGCGVHLVGLDGAVEPILLSWNLTEVPSFALINSKREIVASSRSFKAILPAVNEWVH